MPTTAEHVARGPTDGFRHEALLYAGDDGFLEGTLPWIRDAVAAGEPILVVVSAARIARLREELGAQAAGVGCGASASRSGPSAAPTRSSSASATRRC
jgi:DcmR-like sensory protein